MPLENAQYISQLNPNNPDGGDQLDNGDDHLRVIKGAVKGSLPNIGGVVTASHTELSYVTGVTSSIQSQLNAKANIASPAFTGTPTATTPAQNDDSTRIATTEWANDKFAPLIDAALAGSPTAPTAPLGTNSDRIATMAALAAASLNSFNPDIFTPVAAPITAGPTGKYAVSANVVITLPTAQPVGTTVTAKSVYNGGFSIARNGMNIGANGTYVAEDLAISKKDGAVSLVYLGSSNWEVI